MTFLKVASFLPPPPPFCFLAYIRQQAVAAASQGILLGNGPQPALQPLAQPGLMLQLLPRVPARSIRSSQTNKAQLLGSHGMDSFSAQRLLLSRSRDSVLVPTRGEAVDSHCKPRGALEAARLIQTQL